MKRFRVGLVFKAHITQLNSRLENHKEEEEVWMGCRISQTGYGEYQTQVMVRPLEGSWRGGRRRASARTSPCLLTLRTRALACRSPAARRRCHLGCWVWGQPPLPPAHRLWASERSGDSFRTFTRKTKPESGRDCLVCAMFAAPCRATPLPPTHRMLGYGPQWNYARLCASMK